MLAATRAGEEGGINLLDEFCSAVSEAIAVCDCVCDCVCVSFLDSAWFETVHLAPPVISLVTPPSLLTFVYPFLNRSISSTFLATAFSIVFR